MTTIRYFLEDLLKITEEEWRFFSQYLTEKTLKAGEKLVHEGQVATEIYLIKEGLVRNYHLTSEGREINTYFACDGQFISTYASIITNKPSLEQLEALESTSVVAINKKVLGQAYAYHPKFEKLGRYLAEQNYLCIADRTLTMQYRTAKEKYSQFLASTHKKIIQRVPQRHIASFLGIAPESLSRIRREMLTS